MSLPKPEPGLVISYAYVWRYEDRAGQKEGRKDRPCVIILAVEQADDRTLVSLAPVTQSPPASDAAVELPPRVKAHLGLDDQPSWIITDELNQFVWPGFDLRPVKGGANGFAYGFLPPNLFEKVRQSVLSAAQQHRTRIVKRD
ncbi:growth inhibitor PemK [Asticcacaulis sp.]|uniref:growth inhibitor PemK n=1 Tax=Asticcacaulis sp. TaxID=1872648 RepID=UPI003F7BF0E8